ncbi:unnamed protein product, partial [Coccothraustes coccothraustes]
PGSQQPGQSTAAARPGADGFSSPCPGVVGEPQQWQNLGRAGPAWGCSWGPADPGWARAGGGAGLSRQRCPLPAPGRPAAVSHPPGSGRTGGGAAGRTSVPGAE